MRHREELRNPEVAEVLELNPATVRQRHGRAVLRLLKKLSEIGVTTESR